MDASLLSGAGTVDQRIFTSKAVHNESKSTGVESRTPQSVEGMGVSQIHADNFQGVEKAIVGTRMSPGGPSVSPALADSVMVSNAAGEADRDALSAKYPEKEMVLADEGIYDRTGNIKQNSFVMEGLSAEFDEVEPPPMINRGYPPIFPPIFGEESKEVVDTHIAEKIPSTFAWRSENFQTAEFVGIEDAPQPRIRVDFFA